MSQRLTLEFSGFGPSISQQLRAQKFKYHKDEVKQFQRSLDAIETLYWNDLVSDATKLKDKLYAQVLRHVKKMNKPARKKAVKA